MTNRITNKEWAIVFILVFAFFGIGVLIGDFIGGILGFIIGGGLSILIIIITEKVILTSCSENGEKQ